MHQTDRPVEIAIEDEVFAQHPHLVGASGSVPRETYRVPIAPK